MITDFHTIPKESRIWIYASEIKLSQDQQYYILNHISTHLNSWNAHKITLTAGVIILENHFIVVALDDSKNAASGCSIDTLQNTIQELENELSISLLNRLNVFGKIREEIKCIPTFRLKNEIDEHTLFYDLTIQKKSEIERWLKPIKDGWCASYL